MFRFHKRGGDFEHVTCEVFPRVPTRYVTINQTGRQLQWYVSRRFSGSWDKSTIVLYKKI